MQDILIIGAGVAGMAAAEALAVAGHRPRLVDKARRPGGRCATRRVAAAADAAWFDYGAQYFTARHPAFRDRVSGDLRRGRLAEWRPHIATAEGAGGTWLLTPSPDERERLIGPGGLNAWVRAGLDDLGVAVACERRVTRLRAAARRWQIGYDDGTQEQLDAVLLTLPAVQAAALLGEWAGRVAPLAAGRQAQAACHSVVLRAPALADAQAIFFKAGRLAWAADNSHKAGDHGARRLWTLHAGAEYSQARVETDTRALAEEIIDDFRGATALARADIDIVHTHRWRYARPGPGAPDADTQCWVDGDARLALAGDWLAGGRIEGAWLSGRSAGQRLAAALPG